MGERSDTPSTPVRAGGRSSFSTAFPGRGSRVAGRVLDEAARESRVRVLAPDRPGLGLSSPQPGRTLLDLAGDVHALADTLGIDRLAVVGESGGGPYVLACAGRLGDRLAAAGVVCGLGPVGCPGATTGLAWKKRIGYAIAPEEARVRLPREGRRCSPFLR
jgi:pimeloyl-ACP methyl ester carboxylesterase